MMPSDGLDLMAKSDAIYLGAVCHSEAQDHVTLNGLLLPIRRVFDTSSTSQVGDAVVGSLGKS